MITSGFIICLGLVFWFSRLSWRARMRLLSHPLMLDILVFILLTAVHWGTYTGVMSAAVGALMVSLLLTAGRWAFGYNVNGKYKRGAWDISAKLVEPKVKVKA